jgi:Tfp pilus assembly protein PilV
LKNSVKGFLLLEVVVSIAVIVTGLVFVTRVYSTAKYALARSAVLFESGLLLENRMFEYEEKGKIEADLKDSRTFTDNKGYSWSLVTSGVQRDPVLNVKLNLNAVKLEVARLKDTEEKRPYVTRYGIYTYLKDDKHE